MEFTVVERKEPITLDEVMEFVDTIDMDRMDKHQLKQMIADIADRSTVKAEIDKEMLIRALRCSASAISGCEEEKCHYWIKCKEDDMENFKREHPEANFPKDFFAGCDCDQICIDAAESLEKPERFKEVKLNNGHHAIWDEEKKRLYHCYMDESFMRKIGIEVVSEE